MSHTAGESYRPSNGSEGEGFTERYCDRCERDARYRETHDGRDGCQILAASMLFDFGSPDYPKEWVYGSNCKPTCTAFEEEVSPEERERREAIAQGQTDLFGEERK